MPTPETDTAPPTPPDADLGPETGGGPTPDPARIGRLGQRELIGARTADVGATRERVRRHRLLRLSLVLAPIAAWLVVRDLLWHGGAFGLPHLPPGIRPYLPAIALIVVLGGVMVGPLLGAGRSPHVLYRPGEIPVRFADVRGADVVVEEVVKTLNLFLAHRTFGEEMGGTPRRAILFEGPPGTGKTFLARAMAAEAGVPFLFVSSSAFQSMFYGQTNRKIRSYFRALRVHARREGGAIGFIEEIDAIGASRGGTGGGHREGIAGVVNELLIQLQSFETPPRWIQATGVVVDFANRFLPAHRQLHKPTAPAANILVIGATNRAADLDPALLRPGRFDRSIFFDLPTRAGRRDIIDYYLTKKAHDDQLDEPERRDSLAAMTAGYSPVMIEHLFDEALVWALRRGADRLDWADLTKAKMTDEIGLAAETMYAEGERTMIATHESGHATVAWLVGKGRKLDVLSIVRRKGALGLLAHSETEERFTKTRSELRALIEIAFGGMVAEEVFFGESSSGVAGDLKAATDWACQMIGALGMGSTLVSSASLEVPGAGNLAAKVLATDSGREEVESVLRDAKDSVRTMIEAHRGTVVALRDALLDRNELVGDEILTVIEGARPGPAALGALGRGPGRLG
ncbi:MAG TPA: AAA family ATPase [Acidimicrobiales bacterium]|jgi:ATP-dependent Zn protease